MKPASTLIAVRWFFQVLLDESHSLAFAIQHWGGVGLADPGLLRALQSMSTAMGDVLVLLKLAQSIRWENTDVHEYLKNLKDAAYTADDLLSELDFYRLHQQVELACASRSKPAIRERKRDCRRGGDHLVQMTEDFSHLPLTNEENQKFLYEDIPSLDSIFHGWIKDTAMGVSTSSPTQYSSFGDNRSNIVPRMYENVRRLGTITAALRSVLSLLKPAEDFQPNPHDFSVACHRLTTSFSSTKQTVIGRDSERDQIIKLLLLPTPTSVSMIPIVGFGGIGKTTLAMMVYNHEEIKKHFDSRIWVCVSDDFDVARLTREMLEDLGVYEFDHTTDFNTLQQLLMKKLQSVRYLLVLDDVWNDSEGVKWGSLCDLLQSQKAGSRILMTTRLKTVISIAAKNMDMLTPCPLEGLPEDKYLSLFNTYAFGDQNPSNHPSLVEIGKQIAGKLKGSPLAAKTVGGLLRDKLDEDHWRNVFDSDIWQLPAQSNEDIMPILQLSYQHLPPHLQQCFIYCCVFPKDRIFEKKKMVGMWISHGYVRVKSRGNKSVEEIGSEYFDALLSRSFIEAYDSERYVLHDLLHDLAQSVSENEYLEINRKVTKKITPSVRHVFVDSNNLDLLKGCNLRNLRTLIIDGEISGDYSVLKEVLMGLKSIRVLNLEEVSVQFLAGSIGHLIHLRYLTVDANNQSMPHDSQCRPYHLQWLFVNNGRFVVLPAATDYLVSLRHFGFKDNEIDGWARISGMSGIGKLTCLQELEYFTVGKNEGRKITELKRLNELRGTLELYSLSNVSTKEEALEASLNKKVGIRELTLGCGDGHESPQMAEEVFEGLCPPPYIKELRLDHYVGVESPTWMMTVNCCLSVLQFLILNGCLNWKVLPPLGQLPLLRYLEIDGAYAVEEIGSSFYGSRVAQSFPCLETLLFEDMPEWVVWSGVEGHTDSLFPRLSKLTVLNCPKLERVPMQCLASVEALRTDCTVLLATKQVQRSDQNPQLVSSQWQIEQRESQELHPPILVPYFLAKGEEEATTASLLKNKSPLPPMEFASSLKVLGWFVQMLFDKSLTATLQHWGDIAAIPDLSKALQSLLDELNSVQAMLSLTQNFRSQNKGLLEFLKNLMDAAYDADNLLSELDYYRLKQQVNDSEDEDLLEQQPNESKDEYLLSELENDSEDEGVQASMSSFHHINKATIVPRIHEIVSRLEHLVTCLNEALSLLEPEEGLRASPNVFPVATHHLTTSFLSFNHDNHLEVFAGSEFLSMFNKCAFGGEDPSDHLELDEIAKQIVGKLNGSSLAATIVGGLLRDNLDEQHWRSVLCSDMWQQRRGPHDIMPILRFSYHHLPAHLQQCFAYFGVFSDDWQFKKENLVGMWISQGYIHTKSAGNMSPEEIGSQYFDHLVSRSFIQANQYSGNTYVLHRVLHDLAESVSEDEYLRIESNGTKKITSRVRHIYVGATNLGLLKNCDLKNLRTLIIDGSIGDDNNVLKEVLNGLKSIRVLCLKNVSMELLSGSIGHLIHLRYLTVNTSHQRMPPDSRCRPYHLQWLNFETGSIYPDLVFPAAMNCLVSLRHFTGIMKMYGIGKLTHLQELVSFTVGKKEGQNLGELKRLNELGGRLELRSIENVSTKEEALEANLNKKIGIRKLTLSCSVSHASPQMAEEVYEGLRPPPYIKELTLDRYNGVKSPSWMVTENHCLSYLQSLSLHKCSSWKVLPPLSELPILKHLEIHTAQSVEEIGSSFYGSGVAKAFPCLDTLVFINMPELVVWSGVEYKNTCPLFPRLRELNVTYCQKLKQVPIQYMASVEVLKTNCLPLLAEIEKLTSLRELYMERCPELVSVELKRLPSLQILHIKSCDLIQSLPRLPTTLQWLKISWLDRLTGFSMKQEENLSDLNSLRNISIGYCPNLRSLPIMPASLQDLELEWLDSLIGFSMEQEENMSDLTSLRNICISDCSNLRSLPIMPASLQRLYIRNCWKLPRERYQEGGDDWHKISHVPDIDWD